MNMNNKDKEHEHINSLIKYAYNKINMHVKKKIREIEDKHHKYTTNHPLYVRYSLVRTLPNLINKKLYLIKISALKSEGVLDIDVYKHITFLESVGLCNAEQVGKSLVDQKTYDLLLHSLTP